MRSMLPRCVLFAAGSVLAGCAGPNAQQQWERARSADSTGARVYDAECASCHGATGTGARGVPELVGPGALPLHRPKRQPFRTAQDVFDYTSREMPLPPKYKGSLAEKDYWSVVSFLVRAKGFAVPDGGLSPANARSVQIN
jgi:mono/diheme cytochrome c family protein